jgi:8-oxo-dGTP diphosphatase
VIRAAGGVVIRDGTVLLVHRPRYDDWSLPKGKLEPGESWSEGAVREVEEEAGLRCVLGEELGRTRYVDGRGRDKQVRYYRMTAEGEPEARNEVDEVRWVPLAEADDVLTYPRDRELVSRLL